MRVPTRPQLALACFAALFGASAARAGPPFVTDDPEPTEPGHWEIYAFASGAESRLEAEGEAGLDINYGAATDLQFTAVLPIAYQNEDRARAGLGDIELAVKYRFLHQREGSAAPDVSFFPAITLPTARRAFGSGRVQVFLPLWAQKDFGRWSLFGGGGYQINPGRGSRDYWVLGIALSREITDRLSVGAELFHETPEEVGDRAFTGASVGATYRVAGPYSVLFSVGPGLQNRREEGRYTFYAALKIDL